MINIAKRMNFPSEFFIKTQNEMLQFLKTKDFIVILKIKIHQFFNKMMVS